MQESNTTSEITSTENIWGNVQSCLAALSPFSVVVYDPEEKRLCTPVSRAGNMNFLLFDEENPLSCKKEFLEIVDRAVSTNKILLSAWRDDLSYFVIPIPVTIKKTLTIVAGMTGCKEESSHWEIASKLESAGHILLKDAYSQRNIHALVLEFIASTKFSELYCNDREAIQNNISVLFKALNATITLKSAAIFHQKRKESAHRSIAVFGAMKERFKNLEVRLDFLFRPYKQEKSYIHIDVPYELIESGLPEEISSCTLFTIYEGEGTALTLAIFNTDLTLDCIEKIISFCGKAGTIHENIKLKHQLSRYKETIQTFSSLKKLNESSRRFESFYEQFLEFSIQTLQAERGSLIFFDKNKGELSIKAMKGYDKSLLGTQGIKPGEGIVGKIFQEGKGVLVEDLSQNHRLRQKPKSTYRTTSFISIPIKLKDKTIGIINVADKITRSPFTEEDLSVLETIGGYIAIALERFDLYRKTKELKKISITDPLTGLLNRRTFHERLLEEIERTRRHQVPVSLIILDLDDFKLVNDTFGHQEGDELLKVLSDAIREYIRSIDVPSRYGGEEFTVILPQTRKEDAWIIADRLCKGIEQKGKELKRAAEGSLLAVSVGLATFPDDASSLDELVRNADRALYQAKLQGKNRAIAYNSNAFQ